MSESVLTIRGARGGRPAIGSAFTRYGSHTTCFSVETPEGILVVDAGSGIWSLSEACDIADPLKPIGLFFTHFHVDHVLGLRSFRPLYREDTDLRLHGASPSARHRWPTVLTRLLDEPYWPVPLRDVRSAIAYEDLDRQTAPVRLFGAEVTWCELTHTQRCLGYRFDLPHHRIVVLTDHESRRHPDQAVADFATGADTLIMDAQYLPEEYGTRAGWGHGTWTDATALASRVGAGRLLLCHHDPTRTDEQLDDIQRQARAEFSRTEVAREGMTLPV